MSFEELVNRARKGDEESFVEIVSQRQEILYRIAYTYVKNEDEAVEIVQDTVYKAFATLKNLKEPGYFNTWLTKILINCAIDSLRKSKRIVFLDNEAGYPQNHDETNREDIIDLYNSLDKLDQKQKNVVILRYFQDFKLKDIADILGIPESSVKSTLYRALAKLKIDIEGSVNIE